MLYRVLLQLLAEHDLAEEEEMVHLHDDLAEHEAWEIHPLLKFP